MNCCTYEDFYQNPLSGTWLFLQNGNFQLEFGNRVAVLKIIQQESIKPLCARKITSSLLTVDVPLVRSLTSKATSCSNRKTLQWVRQNKHEVHCFHFIVLYYHTTMHTQFLSSDKIKREMIVYETKSYIIFFSVSSVVFCAKRSDTYYDPQGTSRSTGNTEFLLEVK